VKKHALFIIAIFLLTLDSYAQAPAVPPAPVAAPAAPVVPSAQEALPPDVSLPAEAVAVPPQPPEMTDPLLEGFFEDIQYNPTDRRDPFLPYMSPTFKMAQAPQIPLEPLQRFALSELKLIGIIWDVGMPKALIVDPTGKSHIIAENTKMGNGLGYVAAIREGEIIVVEQQSSPEGKKTFETKILKLSSIKGTP
jgi:type IV pilus assembly protein PilP